MSKVQDRWSIEKAEAGAPKFSVTVAALGALTQTDLSVYAGQVLRFTVDSAVTNVRPRFGPQGTTTAALVTDRKWFASQTYRRLIVLGESDEVSFYNEHGSTATTVWIDVSSA